MTTATFQKGDRSEFKEFPEDTEGKVVELWKRNSLGSRRSSSTSSLAESLCFSS
jgi:hypothetical protein